MRFCTNCVIPDTRPDLDFDPYGVCDACRAAQSKYGTHGEAIDWGLRRQEFEGLIQRYRNEDSTKYDCIVPVSGGKDSTFQTYLVKEVFGLKPLCLCFEPTLPTEVGRLNLDMLNRMGVDLFHIKRDPKVYETLVLEGFRSVGDPEWANHMAIWSLPFRFSVAFDIPLIMWGESPQMEYGGFRRVQEKNLRQMDEDWLNDFGCLNGLRPEDMVGPHTGLTLADMNLYRMPSHEVLAKVGGNKGCVGLFLGYFFEWNVPKHLKIIDQYGWCRREGRGETTYTDYESLDCHSMQIHDYLKYCKFGFGRATDDACRDVRNGLIDRDEAVRLVERHDGVYPKGNVERFCGHFDMTQEEFDAICDSFTNPAIFEMDEDGFRRDADVSLVMKPEWRERRREPLLDWQDAIPTVK